MKPSGAVSLLLLLLGAAPPHLAGEPTPTRIEVDFSQPTQPLDSNLWSSSGVDQGLMTPAFDQDMQLIGSVPHGVGRWMRPHYLLNLIRATGLETDHPVYDWSDFDQTLDSITQAGLTPLFELMGNPSKHFTSFLQRDQVYAWKQLVTAVALHLESRYGATTVRTWLFESWNEPDINNYWKWQSPEEHQHYYDACSEGLKAADPALKFGGPGTARTANVYGPFFQAFLNHCDTGTNYFTGEKGVRLDFISFHCKNRPAAMVDTEVKNIDLMLRDHPKFASRPVFNDEADSEVQWNHPYEYRATPWYAAFIARSVDEHLRRLVDGASLANGVKLDYRLSNDDAFWGPWGFRSQFVQFGDDQHFAFVAKPSHAVRTALALLGERRWPVTVNRGEPSSVGAIATERRDGTVAILVYNYRDQTEETGATPCELVLSPPRPDPGFAHYRIDSRHGDTHRLWQEMGSPAKPTDQQIETLRRHEGLNPPELGSAPPVTGPDGRPRQILHFTQPLPGVSVVVIAPAGPPMTRPVSGLRCRAYASLSGTQTDDLIQWSDAGPEVGTYLVLESPSLGGPFNLVAEVLATSAVVLRPGPAGYVRIKAVDGFGREIGLSAPVALAAR